MEFIQHLDYYEHAKCVELYGWKCYICCVEAKDQSGLEMQHIGDGIVYTVKPTLVSTQEKKTLGTVNYAEQAGEDDLEEIAGNENSSGKSVTFLHMRTSAYQVGNDCFSFRKEEETRSEACAVIWWKGVH